MIQGDNLVGNQKSCAEYQNMDDIFDGQLSSIQDGIYNNNLSPNEFGDIGVLCTINTDDLLVNQSFDIANFTEENLFKREADEELLEEPKNDVFPDLNEHDFGMIKFDVVFNQPENLVKNHWYYSNVLQKIFISLNKTFHFEIEHKPVDHDLFLRVMMVFIEEISSPVKRCQNHIFGENGVFDEAKKLSIIRTENPRAEYCGNGEGKNVNDRLSIKIPLSSVPPNDKNMVKQSIALKFVCQNSCIGRKPTAVIFCLENNRGCILSKKVVNIKVCSCPKRDKVSEEQRFLNAKRNAEQAQLSYPIGHSSAKIPKIKQEINILSPPLSSSSPPSDDNNSSFNTIKMEHHSQNKSFGITHLSDGSVSLTLKLPNELMALEVIKNTYNSIAGEISRNSINCGWDVYLEELNKIQSKK